MIADQVGLTQASVSRITRNLIDAGLVVESKAIVHGRRGRRFIGLTVRPGGCFVAGITINAFTQEVAVGDLTHAVLSSRQLHFESLDSAPQVLFTAADALNELIREMGIDPGRVAGCGITLTGGADPDLGVLESSPVLGWKGVNVRQLLADRLAFPIYVDSIPNAKNLSAQGHGTSRGQENVVLLNASLAIGCSLLMDGRLLRGKRFDAGLIKNLRIPAGTPGGELVPVDEAAGGFGVIKAYSGDVPGNGQDSARRLTAIMESAGHNDRQAASILEQCGESLGYVAAVLNAVLHPELVLLSGPLVESEAYLRGVHRRLGSLEGPGFVIERLRTMPYTNHESALSLAINQMLLKDDLSRLDATKEYAACSGGG